MNGDTPAHILGWFNLVASFYLPWAGWHITGDAAYSSTQARWSMFRRAVFCLIGLVLFYLAADRLLSPHDVNWGEVAAQGCLLLYVLLFPSMRLGGFVSQDRFVGSSSDRRDLRSSRQV